MKNLINLVSILFILTSCNEKNKLVNNDSDYKNKVDTLYFKEDLFFTKDSSLNLVKHFKQKTFTKIGRPVNEKINLTLEFKREYKKLVNHCYIDINPKTKGLIIKKKNDYEYELFIDKNIKSEKIFMNLVLGPKKNYVLKTYWLNEIIKYPYKTDVCEFMELVNKIEQ